jgi:hypothetical protein
MKFRSLAVATLLTSFAGLFASTGGCSAKKNTEIMLGVQTDVRIPKDIDEVEVRVFVDGVVVFNPRAPVGNGQVSLPGSFGIVAGSDASKQIVVEVVGYVSTQQKVLRRARMTFVQGRTVFLRMPLKFACYGQEDCPDQNDTCIAGECKSALIDATKLPEYVSEEQVSGKVGGSATESCFQAESCLPSTTALMPAGADGCTFLAPGDGGAMAFTPVLAFQKMGGASVPGFCDASTGLCKVPVDHDAEEGWEFTDATHATVTLASGLCKKLKSLSGHLEATAACGDKTLDRPLCAPSSGVDAGTDTSLPVDADRDGGTSCPTGWSSCNGVCANLVSDPVNCGQCGRACSAGTTCVGAVCTAATSDAGIDTSIDAGPTCLPSGLSCTAPASCCSRACVAGTCGCGADIDCGGATPLCNLSTHQCVAGAPDAGPCVPSSCAVQGKNCGPTGDGCGGLIDCGKCTAPAICGGGGAPGICGSSPCFPKTCADLGSNCGPAGDGCGGLINCGTCTAPMTCGGGGFPGLCGGGGADAGPPDTAPPDTALPDATSCDAGETSCFGTCTNLSTDLANCGTCGRVCSGGQICFSGSCVPSGTDAGVDG